MDISQDAWHAEQRRKSQDLIRVHNPTNTDYVLVWDEGGQAARFVVPNKDKDLGWGKGMRVMQRYLAKKYTKEMVDKIILGRQDEKLQILKANLEKQGSVDVNFHANQQLLSVTGMRSDNAEVRKPLEDILWMGMEEEFGLDMEFVEEQKPKTTIEDPFERLESKRYVPAPVMPLEGTEDALPSITPPKKRGRPAVNHNLSEVAQ